MRKSMRRSALALMIGGAAFASAFDVPVMRSIEVKSDDSEYPVELQGTISGSDTNSYKVQYCTNLVDGVWIDSSINTNLTSVMGRDFEFSIYEPMQPTKAFYRLGSND